MGDSQTESRPDWKVADLLDLDSFLQADDRLDEAGVAVRDEKIAREQLLSELGEQCLVGDAPREVRSRGIWLWLLQRKKEIKRERDEGSSLFPGEVYFQAYRMTGLSGSIVMLALGAGLVFSLLHSEERYFNVIFFLAATLLPQFLLLALLVVGFLFRRSTGRKSTGGGVLQSLLAEIMVWLAGKVRTREGGEKWRRQWREWKQRNYLAYPVFTLSQSFALMYNIGILAGFAGCLMVMDVRFFWESTPGVAAVETLNQVVGVISAPWGSLIHNWLPTEEGIAATRITMEGAAKMYPSTDTVNSAAVWAPFLAGSIVFWGLLPRLLLRMGVGMWARRSLSRYSFYERPQRELWRRLTALKVETSSEGPDDEAIVLLWGGLSPDADEMRRVLLQQLRLNPLQTYAVGNETDAGKDENAVNEVSDALEKMNPRVRLVVAVESWALAPREATDFLDDLRVKLGRKRSIRLLLLGPPEDGSTFSEPAEEEVNHWEDLVAGRKDSELLVHAYRKR